MKKLAWRNKKKVQLEKKNINLRRLFIKGDLTGDWCEWHFNSIILFITINVIPAKYSKMCIIKIGRRVVKQKYVCSPIWAFSITVWVAQSSSSKQVAQSRWDMCMLIIESRIFYLEVLSNAWMQFFSNV